jgi:hypothetical protein
MSLTVKTVMLLIGAILVVLSSFVTTQRVDLFKLGWGFVLMSLFLI